MTPLYGAQELDAIALTVERYCEREVAVRCARPEHVLPGPELTRLCEEARNLGLLGDGTQPGYGIWDHADDASARLMSVRTLRAIARVNAGVAYALHGLALARWLHGELRLAPLTDAVVCLQGAWGLGRAALPRLLHGADLDDSQRAFLSDYFAQGSARVRLLLCGENFSAVLLPRFDASTGALSWLRIARAALSVERCENAHGLNETPLHAVQLVDGAAEATEHDLASVSPERARAIYALGLMLDGLALLAIGEGALSCATGKAFEYAGMRRQGGALIGAHPAVQLLLGRAEATLQLVGTTLPGLCALPLDSDSLPQVLAARAELHPLLCAAANDALQAFGGLGYMRDTGVEKIVRDQNCLRVLRGSPPELRAFVAEWRRT